MYLNISKFYSSSLMKNIQKRMIAVRLAAMTILMLKANLL